MVNSVELMQLCRLCLVKDQVNIPIFNDETDVQQIFLKISTCLPVKVTQDDNLPKKICNDCSYKLDLCYQFWNTSANSEKQLLTWLNEVGLSQEALNEAKLQKTESNPTPGLVLKQEAIEPESESSHEVTNNVSTESQEYILQQQQLPYQTPSFPFSDDNFVSGEATNAGASKAHTNNKREATLKRKRQAVATVTQPDSDDDVDDEIDDPTETKVAKTEETSDDDRDDDCLNDEESTEFAGVPSTSTDNEQPGPSGLGKNVVDAPESCDIKIEIGECKLEEPWYDETSVKGIMNITEAGVMYCSICPSKTFESEELHQKYVASKETKKFYCQNHISCTEKFTKHELVRHCFEHGMKVKNWKTFFREAMQEKLIERNEEPCEICFELFKNKTDLETHYETHKDQYTCQVCKIGFKKVMDYVSHVQSHHKEKLFTCPFCGLTKEKRGPMKRHIDNHDEFKRYKCYTCGSRFPYYSRYYYHIKTWCKKHIKKLKDDKRYKPHAHEEACEICLELFKDKNDLEAHLEIHEDKYTCQLCKMGFKKVIDYVAHAQKHHEKQLFTCPLCEVTMKNRGTMRKHLERHEQFKRYKCKICGSRFPNHSRYDDHVKNFCNETMKTHNDDKQYTHYVEACEICFELFKNKNDLETHYETHKDQYTCQVCNIGFKRVMDYVCHVQSHHEEKLFTCPFCEVTMANRGPMKKHIDNHDEFKRYKCTTCGSRFQFYPTYYNHIKNWCK